MLTILGPRSAGLSRRSFLTAGALGVAGLTLTDLLQAEAAAGIRGSQKAVINIHLDGGPPHMDMIDPKPSAPVEVRGEFKPQATTVPGLQVTELMPRTAALAERFVFIRSLVGSAGAHNAFQCQSGFAARDLRALGGRPAMGCALTRLWGEPTDPAPTFVDLMQGRPLVRNSARPGFLGPAFKPFRPDISKMFPRELEAGMKRELAALGSNHTTSLSLNADLGIDRLNSRTSLLAQLDQMRREADGSGMMAALDRFTRQAVGILTSGKLAAALDLAQASPAEVEHYTAPPPAGGTQFVTAEDHRATRKLLLARRLIEAGVRCVSVSFSDFDTHSKNFPRMRNLVPIVDHGLCALVTDLEQRGMLNDVSIVVWGEFGRTPRIDNKSGGRHHWPRVGMAMLAGGGMQTGQVIGSTDKTAGSATSRPVSYQDVMATLYANLGINLARTTVRDPSGRPQYLVASGKPLREVG